MSSETEDKPLLAVVENDDVPLHPPPPYIPVDPDVTEIPAPAPPPPIATATEYPKSMPLPTYAQSEKYETEGVLFLHKDTDGSDTDDDTQPRRVELAAGTWCEFVLFFIICSTLSFIGFIFSICVATTVAAQGGAVAGLGIALVSKPIMFEMYDNSVMRDQVASNFCTAESNDTCVYRVYAVLRFCFWIIGLFGVFLFYRGLAAFLQAKQQQTNNNRISHQ